MPVSCTRDSDIVGRAMASTFTNLLYHVVFSTKNRTPSIRAELREPLYEYMGGILRGEGGILLEIGGVSDHVHLLARMKTDVAVARIIQLVKGRSSKWVNAEKRLDHRFEWQEGYGAFSVSASHVERVRRYIRDQERHHRRTTFRDELIALLDRHGITYDERSSWAEVVPATRD